MFSIKIIEFLKQILKGMAKYDQELMKKNGKTFGFLSNSRLILFTVDAKLIKAITVKDFNYFVNRNQVHFFIKANLLDHISYFIYRQHPHC